MKVAFYLNNTNISDVDFTHIEDGNPGVGGSEYSCVLIANELCKRNNIDTILLVSKDGKFPSTLKYIACGNLEQAIKKYHKTIELFILDSKHFNDSIAKEFPSTKFMLWVNNKLNLKLMQRYAAMPNIIKFIHVGHEMYDLYRDSWMFSKMTYIFNAIPLSFLDKMKPVSLEQRSNKVIYIGSLIPTKGFHLLAKAWPKIIKAIPDAELIVIGSGKLYDRNAKLGNYNIAEKSYENLFIPYLINDKNEILDSVHFLGILGKEKYKIMQECKVGVPNPSGISETFGYTAIEMALMGCLVTSMKCPGYIDTIFETNHLYTNSHQISKYIINLLNQNNCDEKYKIRLQYIINNFSIDSVIPKWEDLLLNYEKEFIYPPSLRSSYHHKKIKEFIHIHIPYHIKKHLPCIESFYTNRLYRKYFKIIKL